MHYFPNAPRISSRELEHVQVINGSGPGVRRSKRHLLRTLPRVKIYLDMSRPLQIFYKNLSGIGKKVQLSNQIMMCGPSLYLVPW